MKWQICMFGAMILAATSVLPVSANEANGKIDPTFLHRDSHSVPDKPSDITTLSCRYKPLFGIGDADVDATITVARYGIAVIDPRGQCNIVQYPEEDQIYVVLEGRGNASYAAETVALGREDFVYLPASVPHGLANPSDKPMTVVIMGFNTHGYPKAPLPQHPLKDNIENVPANFVGGHPNSAHFRLLLGDRGQTRDRIDAGNVVTSLFLMEIDPGGTNFPHHHPNAEEVYLILDGHGEQVAGEGTDGVAARHPAGPGDAWFYRLNATVGYYSAPGVKSRILCVRSFYPGMQKTR
jgi:mannose-6-phosphate isomerase-like protein (cupin superfamily)